MINFLYNWVWASPLLVLMTGCGLYYTILLKGLQFRFLFTGLKLAFGHQRNTKSQGDISHFQSLMTALAATIGIGNIAGVSTALAVGGVGALFWMWVTALIGMAVKYAEAILAVKYRTQDERGEMAGGPMYFIEKGLGMKWLAIAFALFGLLSTMGGGNMLQANSIADVLEDVFQVNPWTTAIVLGVLTGVVLMGGIKEIALVAAWIVPLMGVVYISGGLAIITLNIRQVPSALLSLFYHAFSGQAAFGGFAGSTVYMAVQAGISRGLMTSEAGLGTASIAAAAAKTDYPGRQALVSMTGSFLSTIVMCTVTGLVLMITDAFGTVKASGEILTGAALTAHAYKQALPYGEYIVASSLLFFAFTTLIGWAYYGEKCIEYLVGERFIPFYRFVFAVVVIPGALIDLHLVWKFSDVANGLMAYPNLIALALLGPVVRKETNLFLEVLRKEAESP